MFDHAYGPALVRNPPARELACNFFAQHGVALTNAAHLLGGRSAVNGVLSLLDELREGSGGMSVHTRRRIERLHALLSLDLREDAGEDLLDLSCAIDPCDPRVHDICLLSEALGALLRQIARPEAGRAAPGAGAACN